MVPFRIGDCGPKGRGVFATRLIPAATRVATYGGKTKWIWDIPQDKWPHTFQVGYDRYRVPKRNSVGWLINHSCDPNCVVSGMSIVTARDVQRGEELTFDYSSDVDWPGFAMVCRCGSASCRGVVKAYRFIPRSVKLRYGSHVAPYILRRYGESGRRLSRGR